MQRGERAIARLLLRIFLLRTERTAGAVSIGQQLKSESRRIALCARREREAGRRAIAERSPPKAVGGRGRRAEHDRLHGLGKPKTSTRRGAERRGLPPRQAGDFDGWHFRDRRTRSHPPVAANYRPARDALPAPRRPDGLSNRGAGQLAREDACVDATAIAVCLRRRGSVSRF